VLSRGLLERRDHSDGVSGAAPRGNVDRGPGFAERGPAVPNSELVHIRVEIAGAQQGQSHRQLTAVPIERVVRQKRVVGGEDHARRTAEAPVEAFDPLRPGRHHRTLDELVRRDRKDDVKVRSVSQQRLGPKDVSAARERPVCVSRRIALHLRLDPIGDAALGFWREPSRHPVRGYPMSTEMDDARPGEDLDELGIGARLIAYESHLTARRRERTVIAPVHSGGSLECLTRGHFVSEQKVSLTLRCGGIVRALVGSLE
jgi:hypothetical protein